MNQAETEHLVELESGDEFAVLITWDVAVHECSSHYGSEYVTEKWTESEPLSAVITFEDGRTEFVEYSPGYKPKTEAQKILNDGLIDGLIYFDQSLMKYAR